VCRLSILLFLNQFCGNDFAGGSDFGGSDISFARRGRGCKNI
jgi:hypothetical protein